MNKYNNWIGVGFKGGGILGIGGVEYMSGTLRNLGLMQEHHDYQVGSGRIGLGLGGGVGAIACIVLDCPNLYSLNDTKVDDWSINFALAVKWDGIVDALRGYKFFSSVVKLKDFKKVTPTDLSNIRDGVSYISNASTAPGVRAGSGPRLVTIDVPFAGVGYELSASVSSGRIEILN